MHDREKDELKQGTVGFGKTREMRGDIRNNYSSGLSA